MYFGLQIQCHLEELEHQHMQCTTARCYTLSDKEFAIHSNRSNKYTCTHRLCSVSLIIVYIFRGCVAMKWNGYMAGITMHLHCSCIHIVCNILCMFLLFVFFVCKRSVIRILKK